MSVGSKDTLFYRVNAITDNWFNHLWIPIELLNIITLYVRDYTTVWSEIFKGKGLIIDKTNPRIVTLSPKIEEKTIRVKDCLPNYCESIWNIQWKGYHNGGFFMGIISDTFDKPNQKHNFDDTAWESSLFGCYGVDDINNCIFIDGTRIDETKWKVPLIGDKIIKIRYNPFNYRLYYYFDNKLICDSKNNKDFTIEILSKDRNKKWFPTVSFNWTGGDNECTHCIISFPNNS